VGKASISQCRRYELEAEAEDHDKFVVTGTASGLSSPGMKIIPLPAGFVVPAQPVEAPKPPAGTDWVHEIKHDGYRIIVRRDGPIVRLYSRNAYDGTTRLAAIAAAAELKSFTIGGEAVVLAPEGLSRFEELPRRTAAHAAILYAFDVIEHDGEDLSDHPFVERKAALARLLPDTEAGILVEDGLTVFAQACEPGAEGTVSEKVDGHVSLRPVPRLDQGPQSRQHDPLDAHCLCFRVIFARVEGGIRRYEIWRAVKCALMCFDGWDQHITVVGPVIFVINRDLVFGLLYLHDLGELIRLACLTLADNLR
jgi:bifunctional non-homologous end joining protein LigD